MRYTIAHSWTRVRKMQPIYFTKQAQDISLFGRVREKESDVREIEKLFSSEMQDNYVLIAVGGDNPLICYTPLSGGFVIVGPTDNDLGDNAAFFDGMKRICDASAIPVRTLFVPLADIKKGGWPALRSDDPTPWIMDEKGQKFIDAVLSFSKCVQGFPSEKSEREHAIELQDHALEEEPASSGSEFVSEEEEWESLSDDDEFAALDAPFGILVSQDSPLPQGDTQKKQHVHKTPPNTLSKNLKAVRDIIQEFSRDVSFQIRDSEEKVLPVRSDVVLEVKGILPAILVHAFLIWLPISLTEKRSGFSFRLETDESSYLGYKITDLNTPDTMFLVLAVSEVMTTIIDMNECDLVFSLTAMRNWLKCYGHPTQSIDNLIG